ncbi:MAG: ABC transporter permease [bacterium]
MAINETVALPRSVPGMQVRGTLPRSIAACTKFARKNPLSGAAAVFLIFITVVALAAPLIAPYNPLDIAPADRLQAPSWAHPMGTDNLGRDMLSRIIYGGRISLAVGFWSVVLGTCTGAVIGIVSGYYGGVVDIVIQRIVDAMQSFPGLLMALALVSVLGASTMNVIIAISLVVAPLDSRVIRSATLQVRGMDYIAAARSVGVSDSRIMFRHVLPNVAAPFIIIAAVTFGGAILIEASLSFLGLGTPPPAPSWGGMLNGAGRQYLEKMPTLALFPGLAISFTVLALNLLGDGLRETLDPRLKGRD